MCQARKRVQAGIQIVEIEIQPDIWVHDPCHSEGRQNGPPP